MSWWDDCRRFDDYKQMADALDEENAAAALAAWPHLLARVLYVPGVLAAVSRREWEAGCEDTTEAVPETEYHWTLPSRDTWPSWAIAPWARSLAPWGGGDT